MGKSFVKLAHNEVGVVLEGSPFGRVAELELDPSEYGKHEQLEMARATKRLLGPDFGRRLTLFARHGL